MSKYNVEALKKDIIEVRNVIRQHRNAKGDDRCWITDYLVWSQLKSGPYFPPTNRATGIILCKIFYRFRRSDTVDPIPQDAILDPERWDEDLETMCAHQLLGEHTRLDYYISRHLHIPKYRARTINDDRLLYSVLPEKLPADFRLPPEAEFLGRAKNDAGCPNFWDSHSHCGIKCNLHNWGPCPQ